jgi:hypothetical protein
MMVPAPRISAIASRLGRASGSSWRLTESDDGPVIEVAYSDGRAARLRATRESDPVSSADLAFIASIRTDLTRLLTVVQGETELLASERAAMSTRCSSASPGPWRPFLERDGGVGGSSMISLGDSDAEPDLYLWLDDQPATDDDFELVAAARDDIPYLLELTARFGAIE